MNDLESALMNRGGARAEGGRSIKFLCPFHDENDSSCFFDCEKLVYHCQGCKAGGGERQLRERLGLPVPDAPESAPDDGWPPGVWRRLNKIAVTKLYDYRDTSGHVVGYVARADGAGKKEFRPFFSRENGKWKPGYKKGSRRTLYRLDKFTKRPDETVYVVEGEKCVDAMFAAGLLAVCSPGGSGGAHQADWDPLVGRRVVIWPDADGPGEKYSQVVQGTLAALEVDCQVIDVEALGLSRGGDVVDWLAAGGDAAKIGELKKQDSTIGGWFVDLKCTIEGQIKKTPANVGLIFAHDSDCRGLLNFDVRDWRVTFSRDFPGIAARGDLLSDVHAFQFGVWMQKKYDISPGSNVISEALVAAASEHRCDPVRDWMDALPAWDNTARLDTWLSDCTGCDDTKYIRAISAKFLISAVARTYRPGCKVDTMLILHGPQGVLKSTLLATLAGEFFSDQIGDVGNKDTILQIHGPLLIEMGELDAMSRRDVTIVKTWLTSRKDRIRPPYGRFIVEMPRRCVLCGTTNAAEFLSDWTGGRRFWPVAIKKIDLDRLRDMRDQLWAEGRARFMAGENWWLTGEAEELAREEQERVRQQEPWEGIVARYLTENTKSPDAQPAPEYDPDTGFRRWTTTDEVLCEAVKMPPDRQTRGAAMIAAKVLKVLGWEQKKQRLGNRVVRVYLPPDRDESEAAEVVDIETARRGPRQTELGLDYNDVE